MRNIVLIDVARAYLSHPEPLTRQELQALCPNVTLTSSWLHKLQQAKVLKCHGTKNAKYTFLRNPSVVLSNVTNIATSMNDHQTIVKVTRRKATYDELLETIKKQREIIKQLKK
jgi:hypothetical protein